MQARPSSNESTNFFQRLLSFGGSFGRVRAGKGVVCECTAENATKVKFFRGQDATSATGFFSEVWSCEAHITYSISGKTFKESRTVAVKYLRPVMVSDHEQKNIDQAVKRMQNRLTREVEIMRSLNHPNVIKLLGFFKAEDLSGQCLVTPWYRKNLFAKLGGTENVRYRERLNLVDGILSGVEYLNSRNLVHGDLRPDNIMIDDDGKPVIIDFGICSMGQERIDTTKLDSRNASNRGGHARWISPERHSDHQVSAADDVYAFGCVLLFILRGVHPYHEAGEQEFKFWLLLNQGHPPSSPDLHTDGGSYITQRSNWWDIMNACWRPAIPPETTSMTDATPALRVSFLELSQMVKAEIDRPS